MNEKVLMSWCKKESLWGSEDVNYNKENVSQCMKESLWGSGNVPIHFNGKR